MNVTLSQVGIRQFVGQFFASSWEMLIKYVCFVQAYYLNYEYRYYLYKNWSLRIEYICIYNLRFL